VGWCVRELEPCIRSEIKPFTNGMFHQIDNLGIKEKEWRQDGLLIGNLEFYFVFSLKLINENHLNCSSCRTRFGR